jgi:hypothetical protein
MKNLIIILIMLFTLPILSKNDVGDFGMSKEFAPRYKNIDISHTSKFLKDYFYNKNINKDIIESEIKNNTSEYNTPELFAYANYLFINGRRDESVFWFLFADLRGNYDLNRAIDITIHSGYRKMRTQYGFKINSYMMRDINLLKKTIIEVIEFDEKTLYEYNHEWINLHSKNITNSLYTKKFSYNESKWIYFKKEALKTFKKNIEDKIKISNKIKNMK